MQHMNEGEIPRYDPRYMSWLGLVHTDSRDLAGQVIPKEDGRFVRGVKRVVKRVVEWMKREWRGENEPQGVRPVVGLC